MTRLAATIGLMALVASNQPSTVALQNTSEGHVSGADGVQLFYRANGSAGQVLVILHGGPGSNMNAVWPDLEPLATGRRIVLYDQRGGGRSEIIKDASRLTAQHHVRDLEAVRVAFGLERFVLVGESWGAALAILYAAQHPQRIERLLLIGPMAPTREMLDRRLGESDATMGLRTRLADIIRAMPEARDPVGLCREFFAAYLPQFFYRPDAISRRKGSSCDAPPEGVRNYFVVNTATFASLGAFDFRSALAKLAMPAMVVEGALSIPSTVESARLVARWLPNAVLVLIPDAGHYPQVERPDLFFRAVERFLRGH